VFPNTCRAMTRLPSPKLGCDLSMPESTIAIAGA
jgi:hypothetical protein